MSDELAPQEEESALLSPLPGMSPLDQQTYTQRRIVFWCTAVVCGVLYMLFFGALAWISFSNDMFLCLIHSRHLLILILALLLVPSLILGRMIRAVFSSDNEKDSPQTPIQLAETVKDSM